MRPDERALNADINRELFSFHPLEVEPQGNSILETRNAH